MRSMPLQWVCQELGIAGTAERAGRLRRPLVEPPSPQAPRPRRLPAGFRPPVPGRAGRDGWRGCLREHCGRRVLPASVRSPPVLGPADAFTHRAKPLRKMGRRSSDPVALRGRAFCTVGYRRPCRHGGLPASLRRRGLALRAGRPPCRPTRATTTSPLRDLFPRTPADRSPAPSSSTRSRPSGSALNRQARAAAPPTPPASVGPSGPATIPSSPRGSRPA